MSDAIAQVPSEDSVHSNVVIRDIPNLQPTSYPASENFGMFKQRLVVNVEYKAMNADSKL